MTTTPPSSLVSQVNAANARISPGVKKLQDRTKSTANLDSPWLRCLLHGEVDSWKTTTAVSFSSDPEDVRVVVTRGEDQLIPIRSRGIKYVKVDTAEEFGEALTHCDSIWPDWSKRPEPVLVVDDLSRARDMVVSSSKFYESGGQTKEYRDARKIYGEALAQFDSIFTSLNRKSLHIICVTLSKIQEGKISLEETIMPDLPPSIGNLVASDFSFVFFLNKKRPFETRMLTAMDREAVTEWDEQTKKTVVYQRYYFARHKIDIKNKGLIQLYEPADIRKVWEKVKSQGR